MKKVFPFIKESRDGSHPRIFINDIIIVEDFCGDSLEGKLTYLGENYLNITHKDLAPYNIYYRDIVKINGYKVNERFDLGRCLFHKLTNKTNEFYFLSDEVEILTTKLIRLEGTIIDILDNELIIRKFDDIKSTHLEYNKIKIIRKL